MTGTDFIAGQLALKAWQDGYPEGLNGMLAVAFTIRNRVRAGWYGGDWLQVLSHHQEYAATLALPSQTLPDIRVYSINALLQEITGIVNGTREDNITIKRDEYATFRPGSRPVALYYGHTDKIDNPWFLEEICRAKNDDGTMRHERVANMATLTFWS